MQPSLRSRLGDGWMLVTLGLLLACFPGASAGQTPSATSGSSAEKPPTRQTNVVTNETIGLSLVSHAAKSAAPGDPRATPALEKAPAAPGDPAKKAAEIAALRKQIRDKQKRIELLMHLFVTDERKFVQFPGDAQSDPEVEARIRAEQEELRTESAACAQLQARLEALAAASDSAH